MQDIDHGSRASCHFKRSLKFVRGIFSEMIAIFMEIEIEIGIFLVVVVPIVLFVVLVVIVFVVIGVKLLRGGIVSVAFRVFS